VERIDKFSGESFAFQGGRRLRDLYSFDRVLFYVRCYVVFRAIEEFISFRRIL